MRHLIGMALALLTSSGSAAAQQASLPDTLTPAISALDAKVFGAYNRCDLDSFAQYFSPNVEFYHDNGGATFDRKTVIANTRKYICGKVTRSLINGSLKVYPIKGFGAIEEGEHRFCQINSNTCEGVAKFVMIWRQTGTRWHITRVLSYGHRAIVPGDVE
jgi:Domain of unknown function (DUF4440)